MREAVVDIQQTKLFKKDWETFQTQTFLIDYAHRLLLKTCHKCNSLPNVWLHVEVSKYGSVMEFHTYAWQVNNCFWNWRNHSNSPTIKKTIGDTSFYYWSLCSAAHQWGYIAAHVQLTKDRWSKFTSNQCWGRSDGEGSPVSPMGQPRLHCHWCVVRFDMFHQVATC